MNNSRSYVNSSFEGHFAPGYRLNQEPWSNYSNTAPEQRELPHQYDVVDMEESDSDSNEPETIHDTQYFNEFDTERLKQLRAETRRGRRKRQVERKRLIRDLQLHSFPPCIAASSADIPGLSSTSTSFANFGDPSSPYANNTKKLDFLPNALRFRTLLELLSPQVYLLKPGTESLFAFYLSPKALQLISQDFSVKEGFNHAVILRISQFEHNVDQFYDFFPSSIQITVNSEPLRLIGNKSEYIEMPIDITELLQPRNEVKLILQSYQSINVVLGVYFVQMLTVEKALLSFKLDCLWRSARREKEAESKLFSGDYGTVRLSLKCPLSKKRIATPCVGTDCNHFECFDLESFLKIHHRKFQWKCPICNQWMKTVVRDRFFTKVIENVSVNCTIVGLSQRGGPMIELAHEEQQLPPQPKPDKFPTEIINKQSFESSIIEDVFIELIK
ncbi:E3 SUMO-protein ligase PIAS2-like isoform X4 [Leptotrombidium deliense]|uniref:E3 SUMO-protein ligase PIAS2-like isoform X4 n=1 Tax=Leptotrombidium deliense TaxID=299467 RepID=A0A443SEE0_9ACAR|nr:E3 SUMO-protein ligase PIAS2-like isoform X4 [Leptotrombidium deliense]